MGRDSNTCQTAQAISTPKATLAAGLACLSSGDTLIIRAGTYKEVINHNQVTSGLSDAKRTIIKSAVGDTVILMPNAGGKAGDVIRVWGQRYVTFEGLIVDARNVTNQGIRIQNSQTQIAQHITLKNMEIRYAGKNCILVQNDNTYIRILDSKIHGCGQSTQDHGVYLTGSNNLIEGNEIYDNSGHGVHQYHTGCRACSHNIISYNYVHGNVSRGILIGSGDDNIAHHNISANNGTDGLSIGFGNTTNSKAYNNTISNNRDVCIEVRSSSRNSVVKNNVCINNGRNIIADNGIATVISSNNLAANPQLVVDAPNDLFAPSPDSALIDAGEYIPGFSDDKFLGAAPDQGAIEYGTHLDYSLKPASDPMSLADR
jgi:parallel beta-helix repeat protein